MSVLRFTVALALASAASCAAGQETPAPPRTGPDSVVGQAVERGRRLTATACASCHATGLTGASPMADATPLREIAHRYPLDHLEEAFAEGLVTSHPAMPPYTFRASEIDDLMAYLETLRAGS